MVSLWERIRNGLGFGPKTIPGRYANPDAAKIAFVLNCLKLQALTLKDSPEKVERISRLMDVVREDLAAIAK